MIRRATTWSKDQIMQQLIEDPRWRERCLIVLLQAQTQHEVSGCVTTDKNYIGFQQADAKRYTILAQRVLARRADGKKEGECLTDSETAFLMRPWRRGKTPIPTICKYRGQLLDMIEARARAKK